MVKNKDIINNFVYTDNDKIRTKNLFIEGRILYSYGYHFPMAIKMLDGFLVNKSKYSMTTSRHLGILKRELNNNKVIFADMQKLTFTINENILTLKELEEKEFFKNLSINA